MDCSASGPPLFLSQGMVLTSGPAPNHASMNVCHCHRQSYWLLVLVHSRKPLARAQAGDRLCIAARLIEDTHLCVARQACRKASKTLRDLPNPRLRSHQLAAERVLLQKGVAL